MDYYYLDIKPDNKMTEFECFPHFNTTISIYQSHKYLKEGEVVFDESANPFQIFTPIREKVLRVKQYEKVHRIVIVFHPLGIQQFYENLDFTNYIKDFEFFTQSELKLIFATTNSNRLKELLDSSLEKRMKQYNHAILEQSIAAIFDNYESFSVAEFSNQIKVSRQYLSRLFKVHFGISTKKFHEIVLFRKTINKKLFENPERTFTELAYEFNFNDQSHLIKTYKNFTENSPKSFFNKGTVLGQEDTFWHIRE